MKDAVEFNRILLNFLLLCHILWKNLVKTMQNSPFLGKFGRAKGSGELIFGLSVKLKSKKSEIKIQILI